MGNVGEEDGEIRNSYTKNVIILTAIHLVFLILSGVQFWHEQSAFQSVSVQAVDWQ